jgi:hypothetical protein
MIEAAVLQGGGLRHGFFTRKGGYSSGLYASLNCGLGSGDDPELVRRNRGVVTRRLGLDQDALATLYQHHSADVIVVNGSWNPAERPKADALVTAKTGIAVGVLTADCAPVLFADVQAQVIGAAHAGWKGALSGVTDNTIAAMEKLGAKRENIVAVLGPTISQESYEVGPDFRKRFEAEDRGSERWFRPSERAFHHMFDLPGYLAERLRRAGVGQAVDLAICTYADELRFFSYRRTTHRREGDYGRQISAIALSA